LVDKLVLFLIIAVPERWLLVDVEVEGWLWMGVILVVAGSAVGDGERRSGGGDLGGSHCEGVDVGVEGERVKLKLRVVELVVSVEVMVMVMGWKLMMLMRN
jgi:hypothetical protein